MPAHLPFLQTPDEHGEDEEAEQDSPSESKQADVCCSPVQLKNTSSLWLQSEFPNVPEQSVMRLSDPVQSKSSVAICLVDVGGEGICLVDGVGLVDDVGPPLAVV